MYHLGIFGGNGPNPAAAILAKGKLIAFAEEERFCRIKNAPSQLPIRSILFCLKKAKIRAADLAGIGVAWNCPNYIDHQPELLNEIRMQYADGPDEYNILHEKKLLTAFHPTMVSESLRFGLAKANEMINPEKIKFLDHHLCHAASTFYASEFDKALVFTVDGSGEENCTVEWLAEGQNIKKIRSHDLPHTLGGYYGTFTEFLGFRSDSEEGKLMGLAPYGHYDQDIQDKLSLVLDYDASNGSYKIDPKYRFYGKRSFNSKFTDALVDLLGPHRTQSQPLNQAHMDLAFNVQWRLEQVVSSMVKFRIKKEGISNICLAGGVSMNCKLNGVLANLDEVSNIYVQPASSDNGTALGAACLLASDDGFEIFNVMPHAYWGPEYQDTEIEQALAEAKLNYSRSENVEAEIAKELEKGRIIGWMQGRSEIGARALGGRSILANPLIADMRDKLNLEVKHREHWRPFCPSMTPKAFEKYFGHNQTADHMIIAYYIKEEFIDLLPAAVHVDGSVRPQTVQQTTNPKYYKLLEEFGKITGHPVLINTSFNIQGEPIVETPRDALRCFGGTGIDILVIGNYVIRKSHAN